MEGLARARPEPMGQGMPHGEGPKNYDLFGPVNALGRCPHLATLVLDGGDLSVKWAEGVENDLPHRFGLEPEKIRQEGGGNVVARLLRESCRTTHAYGYTLKERTQ